MVLDPISKTLLDVADQRARQQIEEEKKKKNPYWVRCPACGRRVVRKELMKKGCYVCGWQKTQSKKPDSRSYRINCPGCGAKVVREELLLEFESIGKKGCYICGYKLRRG